MSYALLKKSVGKSLTISGQVSEIIWQHMVAHFPSHPIENYFDLADGHQIVVYSQENLPKDSKIEITGKVVQLSGSSKRPSNDKESKVDDSYSEYHILLDSWISLEFS